MFISFFLNVIDKNTYFVFASSSIKARVGSTIVDIGLAITSDESFSTFAFKLVVEVEAFGGSGRIAEVGGALVDGGLAVQTGKAWTAVAHVGKFRV